MFRGTTPILTFKVPFDTDIITKCYITFAQNGVVILEKELEDVTLENKRIILPLSQEDTLACNTTNKIVEIQLRVLTNEDKALASKVISVAIDKILKDGVIPSDEI